MSQSVCLGGKNCSNTVQAGHLKVEKWEINVKSLENIYIFWKFDELTSCQPDWNELSLNWDSRCNSVRLILTWICQAKDILIIWYISINRLGHFIQLSHDTIIQHLTLQGTTAGNLYFMRVTYFKGALYEREILRSRSWKKFCFFSSRLTAVGTFY